MCVEFTSTVRIPEYQSSNMVRSGQMMGFRVDVSASVTTVVNLINPPRLGISGGQNYRVPGDGEGSPSWWLPKRTDKKLGGWAKTHSLFKV